MVTPLFMIFLSVVEIRPITLGSRVKYTQIELQLSINGPVLYHNIDAI